MIVDQRNIQLLMIVAVMCTTMNIGDHRRRESSKSKILTFSRLTDGVRMTSEGEGEGEINSVGRGATWFHDIFPLLLTSRCARREGSYHDFSSRLAGYSAFRECPHVRLLVSRMARKIMAFHGL